MRHLQRPIVLATLLLGASAFAQPLQPPLPTLPSQPQAEAPVVTGRLQRWLPNANGEVDGFLLADGTQVAIAPHLSAELLQAVKPGDSVEVSGWRPLGPPGVRG